MERTVTYRSGTSRTRRAIPEWAGFFEAELARLPLVVILRGLSPEEARAAALAAWEAGVGLLEVTVESDAGLRALEVVVAAAPAGRPVGAGTVTTPDLLQQTVEVGAEFGVAPGLDVDTVQAAHEWGVPFLPGVATPTEAGQALRLGVTTVKAFPAVCLGPEWLAALAGPYPALRIVPTGGVTAQTAPLYLRAGAVGVGVGASITAGRGLEEMIGALRAG